MSDVPRVLYIMGTARSGSTVLEVLLARAPGAFGAGELCHLPRDLAEDRVCACGESASACEVWSQVHVDADPALFREIEWHAGFPRLAMGRVPEAKWAAYRQANARILRAIADVTGADTLIDSSKYPGRGLALARLFPDRVSVLVLTRAPNGLLQAFSKPSPDGEQPPKGARQAVAYYAWTASTVRAAAALLPSRPLFVRFEDLRSDPDGVLADIATWSGLDLGGVREAVAEERTVPVGHLLTANRLRNEGKVAFQRGGPAPAPKGVGRRAAAVAMGAVKRVLWL